MYSFSVLQPDSPHNPQFVAKIHMRFTLPEKRVPRALSAPAGTLPVSPVSTKARSTQPRFAAPHYTMLSQSRDDLRDLQNSPSLSMWPYLLQSAQTQMLNSISIYAETGSTPAHTRTLYMNAGALTIWREMGKSAHVIGEANRPPRTATLSFGMPFSE